MGGRSAELPCFQLIATLFISLPRLCFCCLQAEGKKPGSKAPKIQRLVTPLTLQRKRHRMAVKKNRQIKAKTEAAEYQKLLAMRQKEQREKRAEKLSARRSQRSSRAED